MSYPQGYLNREPRTSNRDISYVARANRRCPAIPLAHATISA